MIMAANVKKLFGEVFAVNDVSVTIKSGEVFGLIGTNGAGKSTLLRMMVGVLKPDGGKILVDDRPVYENPAVKADIFYISDDPYFLPHATPKKVAAFYSDYYGAFDMDRFEDMLHSFQLSPERKISTFSKGMKKQLSVLLGICANTRYLFCDETFDGLDPVMRQAVKSIFAGELAEREFTPVIASHNLRELEDICDCVGILHQGGVLMQKDLEEMKLNIHNIQCVFQSADEEKSALELLDIVRAEKRGSLNVLTVRGAEREIMSRINHFSPVFAEILPLTLEEIFISETEVVGYDIKKLIF
ncbi:MAG: ABC transporter ATP-binding protein [Lachnospiraceae bacterium]|nr:ABC transporter ATP-binding protein [Lachnospiraceae bacterium]